MRLFCALLLWQIGSLFALDLQLPTENHHLFEGKPEKFYMYVDRYFEGDHSQPWEGGSYGFVRTSIRVNNQILQTKFHEGIDIAPIKRDKAGNPLDLISVIAAGKVVYVCDRPGRSNYGKYVVVEHQWENSSVLSLYAHLAEITCQIGQELPMGGLIGRMGYTGAGINRTRAHLHLEIALMLSSRYPDWARIARTINYHGHYNGMNLAGLDVAGFFLAHRSNPQITLSEYLAQYPVYYKVTIPHRGAIEMAARYPWMVRSKCSNASPSWEIAFSNTGMPLSIVASNRVVTQPTVTMVQTSDVAHRYKTRGLLTGEGNQASLARDGINLIHLMTNDFPAQASR